ncbi:MAG TPA: GTPase [Euryarchaeota archaeon]|nr:ATP/GTP-binding protein [Euryarchaeota archaeon]HHC18943.1 GTPase [Euryarchaeota archaeon]
MTNPRVLIYFLGPAGAGKSTLTSSFSEWCEERDIATAVVNLDPGAEDLPYVPDVDVRDYVTTSDVMRKYGLGPNGAQVVAADLMINYIAEIRELIDELKVDYVLVDTPGQVELFAYRPWGPTIVNYLEPTYSHLIFIMDPFLAPSAANFVSQVLLALSVHFRIQYPITFVMNKMDLLREHEKERILNYINNWDLVYDEIREEARTPYMLFGLEVYRAISELGESIKIIPTSAMTQEGFHEIYFEIQSVAMGGEDVVTGKRNYDFEI